MYKGGYHYYSQSRPLPLKFFLSRPNHMIRSDFVLHPAGLLWPAEFPKNCQPLGYMSKRSTYEEYCIKTAQLILRVREWTEYLMFFLWRILFYNNADRGPVNEVPCFWICVTLLGSTSSSLCEHWVNRLLGSRPPSLASGASSRRTSLISLAESGEFPVDRSEDDGEELCYASNMGVLIAVVFNM